MYVNICELLCALLADSPLTFLHLSSLLSMFQNEGMGVPVVVMWIRSFQFASRKNIVVTHYFISLPLRHYENQKEEWM